MHGNLSEDDANKIYKIVKQIFPNKSLPIVPRHVERVMCLTPKTNFVVNYSGMSSVISTAQVILILVGLVVFCIPSITILLQIKKKKFNNNLILATTCFVLLFMQLYIQIRPNLFNSIKKMALLDLFDVIVEKPFYDRIR